MRILLATFALTAIATACSASRDVSGTLDLAGLGHSEATLIALRADGTVTRSKVTSDGRFNISLEPGYAYSLSFRDPSAPYAKNFAQLVHSGSRGRVGTVKIVSGSAIELGLVTRPSLMRSAAAGAQISSDDQGEDNDDQGEDDDDQGDDDDDGADPCLPGGGTPGGAPGGGAPGDGTPADPTPPGSGTPTTGATGGGTGLPTGTGNGGGIGMTPSFLVVGQHDMCASNDEDLDDHSQDALDDSDGDDRPDEVDNDPDGSGMCSGDDGIGDDDDQGEDNDDQGEDHDGD